MKKNKPFLKAFLLLIFVSCNAPKKSELARITEDFNFNWSFYLEDNTEKKENWKPVRLPHDWSVEHSFTQENTAGATGFLPGGIGWYKKDFNTISNLEDKLVFIEFDGVYTNSEVWINDNYLGKRPNGYIPFSYDLTAFLKPNSSNQIKVKVDRSAYIDSRWYPGSGIYRNVKLVTKNKLHIPQWGTFIKTPKVNKEAADIVIDLEIDNRYKVSKNAKIRTSILYNSVVIKSTETEVNIAASSSEKIAQQFTVTTPKLWEINSPILYTAKTEIISNEGVLDVSETKFGIRTFSFDKNKGFFLNGKNKLIKGVCLHHDAGLVGAAVPKGVWKRRLQKLKEAGVNAIRTAHNPPSAEFLDLCDEMGFLVQDEAFDEWNNPKDKKHNYNELEADPLTAGYTEHFTEWAEKDIKNLILRDRNHPSIIMWSIGNEIEWTYPEYGQATGYWGSNKVGNVNYYYDEPPLSINQIKKNFKDVKKGKYDLAETAKNLSKWVKEVDKTRPVTANLVIPAVSNFTGYADALDIVGLSYRQAVYKYSKNNYPDKVFLGTENWAKYHEWKAVLDNPFISGIFLWTGIDYMGESREWPKKGSGSGLLDFAGFKKPAFHMFKSLWSKEPHIYINTQVLSDSPYHLDTKTNNVVEKEKGWSKNQKWGWHAVNEHWNYKKNEEIAVEVYTNQNSVELFLNDKSFGIKKLSDVHDHILKWIVPFTKGKLTVKSVENSDIFNSIETSADLENITIKVDKQNLKANGYDVAHVTIQLKDKNGVPIKNLDKEITFKIEGNCKLLGVDNGSNMNVQDYQNNIIKTFKGKALLILQSNLKSSNVKIKAISGDVESETISINID